MAKIGDVSIFVLSESVKNDVQSTTHPVEKGIDITDHIKLEPVTISVSGEIIGDDGKNEIEQMMKNGEIVSYKGSSTIANAQIVSFSCEYTNEIAGGCNFNMEIKEIRVAKSAYQKNSKTSDRKSNGSQQKQSNTKKGTPIYHTVKKGDSRWSMAKQYGTTVAEITKNNSTKGITTNGTWYGLKVGAKVIVGYR